MIKNDSEYCEKLESFWITSTLGIKLSGDLQKMESSSEHQVAELMQAMDAAANLVYSLNEEISEYYVRKSKAQEASRSSAGQDTSVGSNHAS